MDDQIERGPDAVEDGASLRDDHLRAASDENPGVGEHQSEASMASA